jgi:DUF4097 and DUF4098 domain-containing protein YvlB
MVRSSTSVGSFVAIVGVLLGLLPAPAMAAFRGTVSAETVDIKDTIKKTFKVTDGGNLEIEADRGNVEIRSIRGDEVRIVVERTVSVDRRSDAKEILETHKLDMAQKGNAVILSSRVEQRRFKYRSWKGDDRIRIRIIVEVPRQFEVMVSTGAGNVAVDDLEGQLDIRSGAGNVEVGDVEGEVSIVSGSGVVDVGRVSGPVAVHTGAGNIEITAVDGQLSAVTGAGDITAFIVEQPTGDSQLISGAGNVTVFLSEGIGVKVDAMARGNCTTDFPLKVEGRWMTKTLVGDLNGGGPDLAIKSSVGNVVLKKIRD